MTQKTSNTSLTIRSNSENNDRSLDARQTPAQLASPQIVNPDAAKVKAQSAIGQVIDFVANGPTTLQVAAAEAAIIFTMHPHWWVVKGMFASLVASAVWDRAKKDRRKNGGE